MILTVAIVAQPLDTTVPVSEIADAKWETSVTSNIGIDALFFDGKLDVDH